MSRWAAAALAAVLVGGLGPPAPARADAEERLAGCASAQAGTDLLLLVDESAHVNQVDPDGARAVAGAYLVGRWAAARGLAVSIAGFGERYETVVDWTEATPANADRLANTVRDFRDRHSGVDTDYVAAAEGALLALRRRARAEPGRCQVLVWLAGGDFHISPRTTDALRERHGESKPYAADTPITTQRGAERATAAGRRRLCRDGGLADQLRAAGVLVLTHGLTPPSGPPLSLLRGLATADDGEGGNCGRRGLAPPGDFRISNDLDELLLALGTAADPQHGTRTETLGLCRGALCAKEAQTLVLDPTVHAVQVLAQAPLAGVAVAVQAPGQRSFARFAADADAPPPIIAGQRVTARWLSERTVAISIDRATESSWPGVWRLAFVDPTGQALNSRGTTELTMRGELAPAVLNAPSLRSGERASLRLGVVAEATGRPLPAQGLTGEAALAVELIPVGGNPVVLAERVDVADLGKSVQLALTDVRPGPATLRVRLTQRTADAGRIRGTFLPERIVDEPVTVQPPSGYPQVAGPIDFDAVSGTTAGATVTVTGPGCAWVETFAVTAAPDGVGTPTVVGVGANSGQRCLRVAAGATAQLPVRLQVARPRAGVVAGTVSVRLAQDDPSGAATIAVPFLADLSAPPAAAFRPWWLIAVAVAIAVCGALAWALRRRRVW